MRRPRLSRPSVAERARADINVTPLVDVMLVLLIVFMVTAPMLAAGFRVDLPRARAGKPLGESRAVVLVVGAEGRISVDGEEATPDTAVEAVETHLGDERDRPIRLRVDGGAPWRLVVGLLDGLAARGLDKVGLVTRVVHAPASASAAPDASPVP
jgi:biopolymer transport protein ExbD